MCTPRLAISLSTACVSDLPQTFDMRDRRASRRFSPALIPRRASDDPPPSSSFLILPSEPSVVSAPGGSHLDFTSSATIPDTPSAKTLMCFKQYRGKENSPSKSRRNASLPDEIAELLARDAEEEEDLEKYREVDLAPMDPVMESATAGDLIISTTPYKFRVSTLLGLEGTIPIKVNHMKKKTEESVSNGQSTRTHQHFLDLESQPSEPSDLVEQDDKGDADAKSSDEAASAKQQQLIVYSQHPTFVTVLGLLPQAMFWATAAPIAQLSNKAYDAMVEKLMGLKL